MSDPVTSSQSSPTTAETTTPAAGQTAPVSGKTANENEEKIGTMKDLQQKSPKVYKAILEGIATQMINKMKDDEDRRKETQREYER